MTQPVRLVGKSGKSGKSGKRAGRGRRGSYDRAAALGGHG